MLAVLLPVAAQAEPASYQDNCKTWLARVAAGQYDEAREGASNYCKSQLTKEQAGGLIKAGRAMVSDLVSRGPAQVTKADALPHIPFGKYLVITNSTKFSMNQNATETVIMKLENGEWKVAGYLIT